MKNPLAPFVRRVGAMFRAAGKMIFQGQGGFGFPFRFLLPGAQFDYEAAAGDLWRNSAVAACLRWIKTNFPEPTVEVVRDLADGTEEIQKGHALPKLLKRPNKFYDWYTLGAICSLSAVVDGNFYLRKIRSGSGQVVELWWIPHWLCRPRWKADGTEFIGWYEYQVNGRWVRVEVEDIIHFRSGIDPWNARLGWTELKAALRAICGLNECDTYTAAILRNMGIPGIIIGPGSPEVNIQDDDVDVLKDQFRESYTSEQRGEPMVSSRMFKVEKISMSPKDMQLADVPSRLEDQVCAVIGLPAMVVGVTSGAQHKTYANYGEARRAAYEDCLIPLQKAIASCLTHQLLGDFEAGEGYRVRFDYSGVQCLAEAEGEVAERVGKLYQTHQLITRAEGRQALGYDFTEEDNVYYDETKPEPMLALPPVDSEDNEGDAKAADDEAADANRAATKRPGQRATLIADEVIPSPFFARFDAFLARVEAEIDRRKNARPAGGSHGDARDDRAA